MSNTDDLVETLRNFADAYPVDIFPPPEVRCTDAGAAQVMREVAVPWMVKAADRIDELEKALTKYVERFGEIGWTDE